MLVIERDHDLYQGERKGAADADRQPAVHLRRE
jgi:hypothetical protein